jgi:hypothetical protein
MMLRKTNNPWEDFDILTGDTTFGVDGVYRVDCYPAAL